MSFCLEDLSPSLKPPSPCWGFFWNLELADSKHPGYEFNADHGTS